MHHICDSCGAPMTGVDGKPVAPVISILVELKGPPFECETKYRLFEFCAACQSKADSFMDLIGDTFRDRIKEFKSIEVKACHG